MIRIKNFELKTGSEIFKAFGDESRVRIMHLLYRNKEMCISDLELILDFTQTKTSRHLIYLKNVRLVKYKKVDQWVYYYINAAYDDIIHQIFEFLEKDLTLLKDLEEYKTLYSNNELAIRKLHNKQNKYLLPDLGSLK
jgi:ArsR family transcriptional regulator, arsenate/arsenite/antimonite-responsive transcriptional repressor